MDSLSAQIRENYRIALKMLERVQHSSINFVSEAATSLRTKPQFVLEGFSRLNEAVAIGIPDGKKVTVNALGSGTTTMLSFSTEPLPWMTLEAFLSVPPEARLCTAEIDLRSLPPREGFVDVFLRVTGPDGAISDTPTRTIDISRPGPVVASIDLPAGVAEASEVRLIIGIGEPKGRFDLHRCDVVVV